MKTFGKQSIHHEKETNKKIQKLKKKKKKIKTMKHHIVSF